MNTETAVTATNEWLAAGQLVTRRAARPFVSKGICPRQLVRSQKETIPEGMAVLGGLHATDAVKVTTWFALALEFKSVVVALA